MPLTFPLRMFLEGPAGAGKTTHAVDHLQKLLIEGVAPEHILVIVPQRILGRPYYLALHTHEPFVGDITIVTLSGLARRSLERFWPLVAGPAGFDAAREPIFLTIETAQYYMMRFVRPAIDEGVFDSVSVPKPRIVAQILDNMAKAAIAGFSFDEVADRLTAAWGDRHSSQLQVYRAAHDIGQQYRMYCQKNNLLDYALQLEVFARYLLPHEAFRRDFAGRYHHLIADNIEEAGPLVHDFILDWWDHWQSALLVYDSDGGYRTFLGADPDNAYGLVDYCDEHLVMHESQVMSPDMTALVHEVQLSLGAKPDFSHSPSDQGDPLAAFRYQSHTFYPQMIDWVADQISRLIHDGVPPREIVVLSPFLTDALRFSLRRRLERDGVPTISHRPSRALRDESAAQSMLLLLRLAHGNWDLPVPTVSDVADMLAAVIEGLDPVRARLLANIVYKPQLGGALGTFEQIHQPVRERITYLSGERYEYLRSWLLQASERMAAEPWPPDYFLSKLFGEVLSQPGFRFHASMDSGRIAAQLIESARKFRQVLYPQRQGDWDQVGQEYLQLVYDGVLAALYTRSWRDEEADAVLLAPAFTFLVRNRVVDYQFWLDVGSHGWWERLDQPLTHPYVLTRHYPRNQPWTEEDEFEAQRELLYRVTVGLMRRCRRQIYLAIADLGEQGYEQRGPMLYLFQQIRQRRIES